MKLKLLLSIFFLSFIFSGFSQNVKVEGVIEELGDGHNNAYRVTIPHSTEKAVEKRWTSFLKQNKGKVKSSRKGIRGENVVILAIGSDSLQIFSRLNEYQDGVLLSVAVQQRGVYMNAVTSPVDNAKMEEILRGLALELSRAGVQKKIEGASKELKSKVREQNNLKSDNEKMARDNERMRKAIEKNEQETKENNQRLQTLENEINVQQQTLDGIQGKSRELQ